MEQRSEEWFNARLGKITASNVHKVMMPRGSKTRNAYLLELLHQRLTHVATRTPYLDTNPHIQRGVAAEPLAIAWYEKRYGVKVDSLGFKQHPYLAIGCSPDGLVGADGCIEIKAPAKLPDTHKVPSKYVPQIEMQLWLLGCKWCDFVCYHAGGIHVVRYLPNLEYRQRMISACLEFLAELDYSYTRIKGDIC